MLNNGLIKRIRTLQFKVLSMLTRELSTTLWCAVETLVDNQEFKTQFYAKQIFSVYGN